MKTAIIYRSNEALDTKLSSLKDKVDLFHVFSREEEVDGRQVRDLLDLSDDGGECVSSFNQLICDLTCYPGVIKNLRITIIGQQEGVAEEYIAGIAKEANDTNREIVIVRENLADHIEVEGVDPYKISEEARRVGWYFEKILALWTKILSGQKARYVVVSSDQLEGMALNGEIVVCDHHNQSSHNLQQMDGVLYKNSFPSSQISSYSTIEDIPVLFEKNLER